VTSGTRKVLPTFLSHAHDCSACRAYLRDMAHLEEEIRRTGGIPVPPDLLGHMKKIPERHRAIVSERSRVLLPAAVVIVAGVAAPWVTGAAGFWLSSGMAFAGAFAAVTGMARSHLVPN
jgi:predicted anti-sigma-YlaC factor YlaD